MQTFEEAKLSAHWKIIHHHAYCKDVFLYVLQNASCICNFCKPIPHNLFGHLGLAGFLAVIIIGVIVLMIIAFLVVRANRLTVMHIPFSELHLSDESEVLGEGVHGKVLRGEYRGTQVAVKRMLAPRHSRSAIQHSFD